MLTERIRKGLTVPPTELIGRGYQVVTGLIDGALGRRYARKGSERIRVALRADLRHGPWQSTLLDSPSPAATWLPGFLALDGIRESYAASYQTHVAASDARARAILAGRLRVFGRTVSLGHGQFWHCDPWTGAAWPLLPYWRVPLRPDSHPDTDVKHVWEINRHLFLVDLAKTSWITRDESMALATGAIVSDWIDANPYAVGINWLGPLEVAYRALSWLWSYPFIESWLPVDLRLKWLGAFLDHARFLYRHLEYYESPYNHLAGEAAVLFILGVVFPQFRAARAWRARGKAVLERYVHRQFHIDGGSVEQATVYHHATVAFYLLAAIAGRHHGHDLAPSVWRAIERAIEFSVFIAQPDGLQPGYGDNDDAHPLVFEQRDSRDVRHLYAMGAVLFARPDFKHAAGRFSEDAFWVMGQAGAAIFDRLTASPPNTCSQCLRSSGAVVLRSRWARDADYVWFDCGEQAAGLRPDGIAHAAHGHADALSIIVWLNGQAVLVDPGFLTYNGRRDWERYFRETRAHNTICLDGQDQAVHGEQMAWSYAPTVALDEWRPSALGGSARGRHNGFSRLPGRPVHARTVELIVPGCVVVLDRVTTDAAHDVMLTWQFASSLVATLSDAGAVDAGPFRVTWISSIALTPTLQRGVAEEPAGGWIAPHLGQREAAPRLTLQGRFSRSLSVLTCIVDSRHWTVRAADDRMHLTDGHRQFQLHASGGRLVVESVL